MTGMSAMGEMGRKQVDTNQIGEERICRDQSGKAKAVGRQSGKEKAGARKDGVLILDKPPGFTSFDVVQKLRRLTGEKKIGHTGTLDPMATGVLPLLLGRATKAAALLPETDKSYTAGFRLGEKTDTGDITGQVIEQYSLLPDSRMLKDAAAAFTGEIRQLPPMYSAVSVNGQRLYKLARQGITVERESRPVRIDTLTLLHYDEATGTGTLFVTCSKGTYIRTLIEDMAAYAGTVGVMTSLRRTEACGFTQADALSIQDAKALAEEGRLWAAVRETACLFSAYPALTVTPAQARRFQNGGALDRERLRAQGILEKQPIRVYAPDRLFLGLGQLEGDRLALLKLFAQAAL